MKGKTNNLVVLIAKAHTITDVGLANLVREKRGDVNWSLKRSICMGYVEFNPPYYKITELGILRAAEILADDERSKRRYYPSTAKG